MIRDLNLDIKSGDHIMITGGNGSGKTSVARIISGLWPIFTGVLSRPFVGVEEIMFISQRPYLSIGTLRDQLIYPHNLDDMRRNKRTDAELVDILKLVYLDYIPDREGGFDGIKPWKDVFSGGEKQFIKLT